MRRSPLFSIMLLSGCMVSQSISDKGALILKPQINAGSYLSQAAINPYTQASINHLLLKLYTFDDSEHDQGIQKTLLNAQLDNPIVFANLKPNITYRIKAYAYASVDESTLISTSDANSYTDVTLTNDDRPTVASLKVKLIDRAFSGQSTSSLVINSGGFSPMGSESLAIPKVVSTIAGTTSGYVDGIGTAAKFNYPYALAVDGSGNLYVSEISNNLIRKITKAGAVSTVAGGNGATAAGYAEGTGITALLHGPTGIVFDGSGNLFVCDYYNNLIRKVTTTGVVSTFAGGQGGTLSGYTNGVGTAALFRGPEEIAIDGSGNFYVADTGNNLIRKITSAGVVSTLAGGGGSTASGYADGAGTAAKFNCPGGIVVDGTGNVYVPDYYNHLIRKITPTGGVSTLAGGAGGTISGYADGTGTAAKFYKPTGIVVDSYGNLFVTDLYNHLIRKITSAGVVSTIAGGGGGVSSGNTDGTGTAAKFYYPVGIALDGFGTLYVADYSNHLIRVIK